MKGLPPELDRLMWGVAESGNDQAVDEFIYRNPEHRAEILRRVNMVRGLRNEGRKVVRHADLPRFAPVEPAQVTVPPRVRFAVAGLVLASMAIAAYVGVTVTGRSSQTSTMVKEAGPPVVRTDPAEPTADMLPKMENRLPEATPRPTPPRPDEPLAAYLKPKDVHISGMFLRDALAMVTENSGLHLEIAPGFVDQEVSLEYTQRSTIDILKDMSRQYAFTLMDEGDGRYLVVPVPDSGDPGGPTIGSETETNRRVGP